MFKLVLYLEMESISLYSINIATMFDDDEDDVFAYKDQPNMQEAKNCSTNHFFPSHKPVITIIHHNKK